MGSLRLHPTVRTQAYATGGRLRIGDVTIHSMKLPHDAPQVGLVFETRDTTVGLVTDLGHVPKDLPRFLGDCETILLESNHDPDMLETGPYPVSLKRRVGGRLGHLSNGQAGDLLAYLPQVPRRVVLMHLSETNNAPRLALTSARAALAHGRSEIFAADPRHPLELGAAEGGQLPLAL